MDNQYFYALKNAFIIGAMRSGTTSLFHQLAQHPQVCASVVKEPEYFSEEQSHKISSTNYDQLFEPVLKQHKITLEASTGYSKFPLEKDVPKKISESCKAPRFIYLVRNPFDRIESHFNSVIKLRGFSTKIDDTYLVTISNYYLQLKQFLKYFDKNSILIVDFENLIADSQKTYKAIFNFLDLPSIELQNTSVKNSSNFYKKKISRFNFLQRSKLRKDYLSPEQKLKIAHTLNEDMILFGQKFDFDVSKWGFN